VSNPIIECRDLTKTFSSSAEVLCILDRANFAMKRGQICTILGPSGSGKSTFLAILGSLERFDSGDVHVDGYDLSSLSEKSLSMFRRNIVGFVFQFHFLLNDFTALENVALPSYVAGTPKTRHGIGLGDFWIWLDLASVWIIFHHSSPVESGKESPLQEH